MAGLREDKRRELEKVFQVPARLRIMSVLMVKKTVDFSTLIKSLDLTRGNLSMHMKMLAEKKYVRINKKFVNNKPRTTYILTEKGKNDFSLYISVLDEIISQARNEIQGYVSGYDWI